jgi:hypothetical protein
MAPWQPCYISLCGGACNLPVGIRWNPTSIAQGILGRSRWISDAAQDSLLAPRD